jgi:hypothetical protein
VFSLNTWNLDFFKAHTIRMGRIREEEGDGRGRRDKTEE